MYLLCILFLFLTCFWNSIPFYTTQEIRYKPIRRIKPQFFNEKKSWKCSKHHDFSVVLLSTSSCHARRVTYTRGHNAITFFLWTSRVNARFVTMVQMKGGLTESLSSLHSRKDHIFLLRTPAHHGVSKRDSNVTMSVGKSSFKMIPRSRLQSSSSMNPNQYITMPGPNLENKQSHQTVNYWQLNSS